MAPNGQDLVEFIRQIALQLVPVKPRKADIRLPGKGNSNSHDARPVHQIISLTKWIRTSRLSIKNSLSLDRTWWSS